VKLDISENILLKIEDTDGRPLKKRRVSVSEKMPQVFSKVRRRIK
jgi:hypothetical protein